MSPRRNLQTRKNRRKRNEMRIRMLPIYFRLAMEYLGIAPFGDKAIMSKGNLIKINSRYSRGKCIKREVVIHV